MAYYVLFQVSSVDLAFLASEVEEVLPCPLLQRMPGLADSVAGLFRLDGNNAVALRLDRLLGLAESPPGLYSPLVRLKAAAPPVCLIVDRVCDVLPLGEMREAARHRSFNQVVVGEIEGGGRTWHVLDPARILLLEEQLALAEFGARADERLARLVPA
ncbi:chemotaxis protein CheW [Geminicoccus roseus]|uniref:chemotaxis protein CheW n=1 Tax=Geminicoccus roseus TaxID=404900 RepID=UPI000415CFBB|nr:chemotaxis protein CheW [Geminicoccus roseus]